MIPGYGVTTDDTDAYVDRDGIVLSGQVDVDAKRGATVHTLSDVIPERVTWLWPGRLPAGKLVVIDGDPSTGKSTLTLDLAARLSTGDGWPDGAACPVGDVLLLSAEDGLADTIAPRLAAAGADGRRVHALTEVILVDEEGNPRPVPPSLPRDIAVIEKIINQHRVRLCVVDVVMAYLSGKVDSHRDQDVRGVLHQLAAMAERTGCTIVLVRHMNKSGGSSALYRGGGSIGIIGAARAAFLVGRDPEDFERRIVACTKSNLAPHPPALAYRLIDDPAHGCARVEWEPEPTELTADQLLAAPENQGKRTEQVEAADWLRTYLESSPNRQALSTEVKADAAKAGIAVRTLERARHEVATVETSGFPRRSTWTLRDSGATTPGHILTGGTGARGGTDSDVQVPGDQSRHKPQSRQSRQPRQSSEDGATAADHEPLCAKCGTQPSGPGGVMCVGCAAEIGSSATRNRAVVNRSALAEFL